MINKVTDRSSNHTSTGPSHLRNHRTQTTRTQKPTSRGHTLEEINSEQKNSTDTPPMRHPLANPERPDSPYCHRPQATQHRQKSKMAISKQLMSIITLMQQQMAQVMQLQEENSQLRAEGRPTPEAAAVTTTTTRNKTKTPDRPTVDAKINDRE